MMLHETNFVFRLIPEADEYYQQVIIWQVSILERMHLQIQSSVRLILIIILASLNNFRYSLVYGSVLISLNKVQMKSSVRFILILSALSG